MQGRRRLWGSVLISVLAHAALYGGGMAWLVWQRDAQYMEIDLQSSSLLLRPKGLPAAARQQAQDPWLLSTGKSASRPLPLTRSTALVPDDNAVTCPPPCPGNSSDWMPAAAASRRPEWADGQIREEDYPAELRSQNVEGLVVAEILVDASGRVQKVDVSQSPHAAFTQLVTNKLLAARFHPGLDREGNPVAVRMRLPIRFELR